MATNLHLSESAVNTEISARATLLNNGYLKIYDGTQLTDADGTITTQVNLATLRFGATAFGTAVGGVATANAITSDPSAAHSGTPTWYLTLQSDGITPVSCGSVGVSGNNLNITTGNITAGTEVTIPSFIIAQPKS